MAPFSFATPAAPAAGGFASAFGGSNTTQNSFGFGGTTTTPTNTQAAASPVVQVPAFADTFPDRWILERVREALRTRIDLPRVLEESKNKLLRLHESHAAPVPPNHALRQQLAQNPVVVLDGNKQGRLLPNMLQDVCSISDELRISEVTALSLYQKATQFPAPFTSPLMDQLLGGSVRRQTTVKWMAREYYFDQRPSLLLACRAILHDQLLRNPEQPQLDWITEWIPSLLQLIRTTTRRMQELVSVPESTTTADATTVWTVTFPLALYRWERTLAAECLYFIAYQQTATASIGDDAVLSIVQLLHELTNNLPVLDPFHDVPDPYTPAGSDKDQAVWRAEWVASAHSTGLPDRLRLCSVLTVTLLAVQQGRSAASSSSFTEMMRSNEAQWHRLDFHGILCSPPSYQEWVRRLRGHPFTLARLGILPALATTKQFDTPNVSPMEFYIYTLGQWGVESLKGAVGNTISREKWDEERQEELRLHLKQQEDQRQLHGQYGGGILPPRGSTEDSRDRPDCLDDVVAFCSALCASGPEFASPFCQGDAELVRTIRELEVQQQSDASLRPCFLSFLGSLASADAAAVFEGRDWPAYLATIRRYTQLLDPQTDQRAVSSRMSSSTPPQPTAYYYFNGGASGSSAMSAELQTSPSSASCLGEADTASLLSHLYLISMVAKYSVDARLHLVRLDGPVLNGRETISRCSLLTTLMTLSVQALSPTVRGAVLTTVSNLLNTADCETPDQLSALREAALQVWDLLEQSQLLPISHLEQYPSVHEVNRSYQPVLSFPNSSRAIAEMSKGRRTNSPFQDEKFGILFEMELVETSMGCYPSTEGFLRLLASLVKAAGCPPELGQNWRSRPGCLPYIEYVIHYVLPRASGNFSTYGTSSLEFRSTDDRSRLESLALHVVEAVLIQYNIPSPSLLKTYESKSNELTNELKKVNEESMASALGFELLEKLVYSPPSSTEEAKKACEDFVSGPLSGDSAALQTRNEEDRRSAVPRPKVPGFAIVVELLSANTSQFLKSLVAVLTNHAESVVLRRTLEDFTLVKALYLTTTPSFGTAKSGASRHTSLFDRESLKSKELYPPMYGEALEEDGLRWESESLRSALLILAGVLGREAMFSQAVMTAGGDKRLCYVPVLRFSRSSVVPVSDNLHLSPMAGNLFNVSPGSLQNVWFSLMRAVGFASANATLDFQISSASSGSLFYLFRSLSPSQVIQVLQASDHGTSGSKLLVDSLSKQIESFLPRRDFEGYVFFLEFVLKSLLLELRSGHAHVFKSTLFDSSSPLFKSILFLLSRDEFLFGHDALACSGFEVIYRLTTLSNDLPDLVAAGKRSEFLWSIDFWGQSLGRLLRSGSIKGSPKLIHSVAWLLMSFSQQIYLLSGCATGLNPPAFQSLLSPKPELYQQYCRDLLGDGGYIFGALHNLAMENLVPQYVDIPLELVNVPAAKTALAESKQTEQSVPEMNGAFEEIRLKVLLNKLVASGVSFDEETITSWVKTWNNSICEESASVHLSKAMHVALGSIQMTKISIGERTPFSYELSSRMGDLLQALLTKTVDHSQGQGVHSRQHRSFSSSANNLSHCIVITTDVLVDINNISTSIDLARTFQLLARSIVTPSMLQDAQWGEENSTHTERTALLAIAHHQLASQGSESDIRIESFQSLENVMPFILSISSSTAGGTARLLRQVLCGFLAPESHSSNDFSVFCRELLQKGTTRAKSQPSTILQDLIALLPSLDDSVAPLLAVFGSVEGISTLMLEYNVLDKLQETANKTCESGLIESPNLSYSHQDKPTPSHLIGHIELVTTILSSPLKDAAQKERVVRSVLSLFRTYESIFNRICAGFPEDGDVISGLARCLVQALHIQRSAQTTSLIQSRSLSNDWDSCVSLATKVVRVSFHLAEHPLPMCFLCSIPPCFKDENGPMDYDWWSKVTNGSHVDQPPSPAHKSLDVDTCAMSAIAVDFCRHGLALITALDLVTHVDYKMVCRCIFRVADVCLQLQNQRNGYSSLRATSVDDTNRLEEMAALSHRMDDLICQLLRVSICVLLGTSASSRKATREAIAMVLQNSRLSYVMAGRSTGQENDQNQMTMLYNLILKECEADTKGSQSKLGLLTC